MIVSLLALFAPSMAPTNAKADNNVATWILCGTEDGKALYNAATTDLVPYSIRSKSSITSTDRIDGFLNSILGTAGFNFKEVNETILGRPLEITEDKTDEDVEDETPAEGGADPNESAPRVNPFDRFGVAGLRWSSYSGEWKYYQTDGCADQEEASKTNFGEFYEDRKEPKASFNETASSNDPRVIQYNKGVFRSWMNAFNGMLTNGLLNITKVVVTFTVTLIGYSFTDVTDLIGIGASNETGGLIGLFNNLYSGFFLSMISVAFIGTTCYVIYYGLIKRQIRQALVNGLLQSILCLFAAFVIAGNASFWIPLPNQIATYGQALVISALGQSSDSTNGLCGTNVGGMKKGSEYIDLDADENTMSEQMVMIGDNMKSTIGCRMWEEFLLKPWTRGQFGSEYKDLVVAGAPSAKLQNKNSEWTKLADVPLGGGVVEHNLALFQLSTQTNAHAQLSGETGVATDSTLNHPQLVDGVSTDWWRVSDILSNYNEKEVKVTPPGGKDQVSSVVQTEDLPLDEWQYWIGNKQHERYSTALLSVIFGVIGSIGPLVFGFLSAAYSVGVTLLMALSPIFLLMGVWAGRGQAIFRGWLEALVSTMIKKIVASALLLVSFAFTIAAMDIIEDIGWLTSFVLLSLVTYILIKNRQMVMDMFSRVNFGGFTRPDKVFASYAKNKTKYTKDVGMIGAASIEGAKAAKEVGLSAKEGALMGAGLQMENTLRKSTFGRNVIMQSKSSSNTLNLMCSYCHSKLDGRSYMDDNGNTYCPACASDMGLETELIPFNIDRDNMKKPDTKDKNKDDKDETQNKMGEQVKGRSKGGSYFTSSAYVEELKKIRKQRLFTREITQEELINQGSQVRDSIYGTSNKSWISYSTAASIMNIQADDAGNIYWDNDGVLEMIDTNLAELDNAFVEYEKSWREVGENAKAPSMPEPIKQFASDAVVSEAWKAGRYSAIKDIYREAWSDWYLESSMSINTLSPDEVKNSIDIIGDIGRPIEEPSPGMTKELLSSNVIDTRDSHDVIESELNTDDEALKSIERLTDEKDDIINSQIERKTNTKVTGPYIPNRYEYEEEEDVIEDESEDTVSHQEFEEKSKDSIINHNDREEDNVPTSSLKDEEHIKVEESSVAIDESDSIDNIQPSIVIGNDEVVMPSNLEGEIESSTVTPSDTIEINHSSIVINNEEILPSSTIEVETESSTGNSSTNNSTGVHLSNDDSIEPSITIEDRFIKNKESINYDNLEDEIKPSVKIEEGRIKQEGLKDYKSNDEYLDDDDDKKEFPSIHLNDK